jgi:hypothetical protein
VVESLRIKDKEIPAELLLYLFPKKPFFTAFDSYITGIISGAALLIL